MKKLLVSLLAVLALAAPALAADRGPASPFGALASTVSGRGALVVVTPDHRVAAYDVPVWGAGYVAVWPTDSAFEALLSLGAAPDATGVIALTCRRAGHDVLALEPGQGGYAVFCR